MRDTCFRGPSSFSAASKSRRGREIEKEKRKIWEVIHFAGTSSFALDWSVPPPSGLLSGDRCHFDCVSPFPAKKGGKRKEK